jgi:glycerol-3-phosphate dehydrogenase (NAD(P)+)
MKKIIVLGAGVMGTAFSQLLSNCGHDVQLVGTHLDREIIQIINDTGIHPKLNVKLSEKIIPNDLDQLGELLSNGVDLIVLGVNSAGVSWVVETLGNNLSKSIPIIMITKGMSANGGKIKILPEFVKNGLENFGLKSVQVAAVAGPCIAGELAVQRDSSIVITHQDIVLLDWLMAITDGTDYCQVRPSRDVIGVEVCAAFKNYYALGIGFADGQMEIKGPSQNGALMNNASAGLFVQAVTEMKYLLEFFGGEQECASGLAGVGDLYVTCLGGRNSRMGRLLGTGLRYSEAKALHMPDDTVEGAELALTLNSSLNRLFKENILDRDKLPLTTAIQDSICNDSHMHINWDKFYS